MLASKRGTNFAPWVVEIALDVEALLEPQREHRILAVAGEPAIELVAGAVVDHRDPPRIGQATMGPVAVGCVVVAAAPEVGVVIDRLPPDFAPSNLLRGCLR